MTLINSGSGKGEQASANTGVLHTGDDIIRELAGKLGVRSRHLIFLLGAGASCAAQLPDLEGLKSAVTSKLDGI